MPTLTIDNLSVTVPAGSSVIAAAQALGLVVPHFCYHEALGAVGACRLCAVTFVAGPVKGVQMACMVEAQEGMVVLTGEAAATSYRSHVIEWLMAGHPHDCPVCDEGGSCQLQEMTLACDYGERRYRGRKRTFANQNLGPLVEQETNRCIACYRCVRTYRDYGGGSDFGVLGARQRLVFGRLRDGRLESPFSGNIIDLCPTGVFTDKPFRFKSRPWDLEEAPSICPHCSLGCATIPGARYRELQRVRGGIDRTVNGFFLCDRGRFGYGHANREERLRTPLRRGGPCDWPTALEELHTRLAKLRGDYGLESLALLGSARNSLETQGAMALAASELGLRTVVYSPHPQRDRAARAALQCPEPRSLEEIRQSDCVVLCGAAPGAEGPLLGLAVRQASRRGAFVASLDPRPCTLPCPALHLAATPAQLLVILDAWSRGAVPEDAGLDGTALAQMLVALQGAQRPVLVGGGDLLGSAGIAALGRLAEQLATPERPCGVSILLDGPGSRGGAFIAGDGPDAEELLTRIETGEIRGLICVEADPLSDHPQPERVARALARLSLLVVLDALPSLSAQQATLLLPTTFPAEMTGAFLNQEGRLRPFARVFAPGLPIRVTGADGPPPHDFANEPPGSLPQPAWQIVAGLAGLPAELAALRARIAARWPALAPLPGLVPGEEAPRLASLPSVRSVRSVPSVRSDEQLAPATLQLLIVESFLGSELLSSLSPPLATLHDVATLLIHPATAAAAGLEDGAVARLAVAGERLSLPLRCSAALPPGLLVAPYLRFGATSRLLPGVGPRPCTLAGGTP